MLVLSILIWDAQAKKASSPLWKTFVSLKDQLVQDCGSSSSVIATMSSWYAGTGRFLTNAYEHFRVKGSIIHWDRVVWDHGLCLNIALCCGLLC